MEFILQIGNTSLFYRSENKHLQKENYLAHVDVTNGKLPFD